MHLPGVVELGYTGENGFRTIQIDMRPWLQVLPDGVASIVLIRPGETADDAYIAATTMEDGILTWQPGAGDLGEVEGYGQMEVWLEDTNEKRGKSAKCQTFVQGSLSPTSETTPPAQESWLEQMTGLKTETVIASQAAEAAKEAAESAQADAEAARDAAQAVAGDFQGLSATASGLAAGTSPTVNVTHDEGGLFNLAFGIPKGDKGDQGDPPTDSQVQTAANNYLSQVITNPDSPPLDRALSSNAAAAPADMVGNLKSALDATNEAKTAVGTTEFLLNNVSLLATCVENTKLTGASITPNAPVLDVVLNGAATGEYDGMTIIDGVNVKVSSTNGQSTNNNKFMVTSVNKLAGTSNFITDWLVASGAYESINGRAANNNLEISILKTRCAYSVQAANEYFQKHPLRLWYKTPNVESATKFYYYVRSTLPGYNYAVGTLEPIDPLAAGDKIDFGTGVVTRANNTTSKVAVSGSVLTFPSNYAVHGGTDGTVTVSIATSDTEYINKVFSGVKVGFTDVGYIQTNGAEGTNSDYRKTTYIPFTNKDRFQLIAFNNGSSSCAYAFYNENKQMLSYGNNIVGDFSSDSITMHEGTKYVRFSTNYVASPNACIYLNNVYALPPVIDSIAALSAQLDGKISEATPYNLTFFTRGNWFEPENTTVYNDRFVNENGYINSSASATSLVFAVKPNTTYFLEVPNSNRGMVGESATNTFAIGTTVTNIYNGGQAHPIEFTTGPNAKYVIVYVYNAVYDWNTYKDQIILNIGEYTGDTNKDPYIDEQYMPANVGTPLADTEVLIFGDSITDTCNFTINSSKQTTAMTWKNPSNSYVDAGGTTIRYSMWAKILKQNQPCKEVRNYARSGASYRTREREAGEERQNLQYQIDVALNDKNNPNNVFDVDNFVPDIVIFALGTNDGTPNDTFESAMQATVYKSDGVTIDVDATLAALDDTKTIASARKAFLRVKQAFPLAQIYCVLPIQRANDETNWGTLREYLSAMAKRCGCIIIDGTSDSGITREFNNWNALGLYLKDGLHPNEKGQNMMARMIITALKSHFVPLGNGFNN